MIAALSESTQDRLRTVLSEHADDPRRGYCRRCGVSRCSTYESAAIDLMMAGVIKAPLLCGHEHPDGISCHRRQLEYAHGGVEHAAAAGASR